MSFFPPMNVKVIYVGPKLGSIKIYKPKRTGKYGWIIEGTAFVTEDIRRGERAMGPSLRSARVKLKERLRQHLRSQ